MWTAFERGSTSSHCGMKGHFARDCGRKTRVKVEAEMDAMDIRLRYGQGARKKKGSGKSGDSVRCAVESDTRRQSVDGESLASRREMPTAEEVEDNMSQRRLEKSRKWTEAPVGRGADPSVGHLKTNAMNHVNSRRTTRRVQ